MPLPTTPKSAAIFSSAVEGPDETAAPSELVPDGTPGSEVMARLAARVSAARHRAGLTLAAVAQRSGISTAYVSQIESGTANPTVRALIQIAAAVDTDIAHLIGGAGSASATFAAHRTPAALAPAASGPSGVWDRTADGSRRLIARLVHGGAADHAEPVVHAGEEFVLVLRGSCRLHVDGAVHALAAGDACHFSAEQPHHLSDPSPELTLSVVMSEE